MGYRQVIAAIVLLVIVIGLIIKVWYSSRDSERNKADAEQSYVLQRQRDNNIFNAVDADDFWLRQRKKREDVSKADNDK